MQNWYALYTKPHKERQVAAYFSERGLEVYYPTTPAPRRRGRSDERPFFPCYLFVRTEIETTGLWALHYAPGTRRVVMIGDKPAPVDDRLIEAIRVKLASADVIDAQGEIINPGDRVVITSGPFKDVEAMFDRRLSPQGRVRVLIELIERMASVEIDADAIRKTKKLPAPPPRARRV
jgi:transcriptional antiterminator RfaH